jgi:sec-independent protein translocase protein TatC
MSAEPAHTDPPDIQSVSGYAGGPEMTLLDHLKELRNRVLVCAVALVLGTLICIVFWETILGWLLAPARQEIPDFQLRVTSPTETIGIIFKIGLYGGLILASPVLIYELLAFIVPGLTPRERRMIFPGLIGVVVFLCAGMAFAYWIILPRSLGFLLNLGGANIEPIITAGPYMSFATRIIFGVGIAFEVPMVLAMAARLGIVRARQLLKFWRYAVIIIFIIAAIITPTPDPYNQTLVAGPLFFLYFIGILMAWAVQKRHRRGQAT